MKRKLFISDFDGTMFFGKAEIPLPPENAERIHAFQQTGGLFVLCTGRQLDRLTPQIEGKVEPDFYITSTGACIVDRERKLVFHCGIPRGTAKALMRELRDTGRRLMLDVDGRLYGFVPRSFQNYQQISDVDEVPEGTIRQISLSAKTMEEAVAICADINARRGGIVEAFPNTAWIDIVPRGCSKGTAARFLRDRLREALGDCTLYGIGDGLNDLPLIEAADVSYTFPYAPEVVQKSATKVVENFCLALDDCLSGEA